jgi:flagellum-specific ATP synthase
MEQLVKHLNLVMPTRLVGRIARTEGMLVVVQGMPTSVGATVQMQRAGKTPVLGEVVGFRQDQTLVFPYDSVEGLQQNGQVELVQSARMVAVSDALRGRVIDGLGQPIDGGPPVRPTAQVPLIAKSMSATRRPRIEKPISTGVRAIDSMLTCGRGQRMGIFAGSGVGKSMALGMMARHSSADINVVGLIGERGREVNEFIERNLGPEGLKRSVVVVATSDQPALLRVRAAHMASAIAEYFRDAGKHVLLMMDSLTRFAMAQREIGLATGEPPATRGYPPSAFSELSRLVERAGTAPVGSITAFYTVLVEGDDTNEPVSDAVRGLLDGHTVLDRTLASKGHWPAIDVLSSLSRLFTDISNPAHINAAMRIRELLAAYRDHADLVSIGAYRPGSNIDVDIAIAAKEEIKSFLCQSLDERTTIDQSIQQLLVLASKLARPGTVQSTVASTEKQPATQSVAQN